MSRYYFILTFFVTLFISGCAVSKSDSSSRPAAIHSAAQNELDSPKTTLESDQKDKENNENNITVTAENRGDNIENRNDNIETLDKYSDRANPELEALIDEMLKNNQEKVTKDKISIEKIYPDKAFSTLKEPWTIKQFEKQVSNKHVVDWNSNDDYHEDSNGKVKLYQTEKSGDGKTYLVAREHGESCYREAYLYLGIRDYDKEQMVVNFYTIDRFLVQAPCGTSYKEYSDITLTEPEKVTYKDQAYLRIDIIYTHQEEHDCTADDIYNFDENGDVVVDENGDPEINDCEAIFNETDYIYTYLYKLNL